MSSERANKLLKRVKYNNCGVQAINFPEVEKSCRNLVHKENIANSMISTPVKVTESLYEADVLIDDQCDDIRDHVTGQHIPGMILVEASRQMFLAVTEQFYLKNHSADSYFVINKCNVEYRKFVFPLDIKITYAVNSFTSSKPGTYRFSVAMEVRQNDEICVLVNYEFSTYDAIFLSGKENQAAKDAILYKNFGAERYEVTN